MKELSIEEKAKRYDEAIERAEGVIEQNPLMEYLKKGIEYILPELKESEDEKIRKELIEFVKSRGGFKQEYIAWLEKQGEHTNFRNKIQIGDKVTRNEDGVLVNLSQLKRVAKKDEKQGGQKPVWSQEDEDILNTIINHFKIDIECTDEDDTVRWLKSLKDRVQPQPKQEWSEEGERLRKEIVNYLECQKEDEPTRKEKINSWISWILKHSFSEWTKEEKEAWNKRLDCVINILDWAEEKGRISLSDCQDYSIMLKSLSPQTTWKPSDEQITWLYRATDEARKDSRMKHVLNELLSDLKKLREE